VGDVNYPASARCTNGCRRSVIRCGFTDRQRPRERTHWTKIDDVFSSSGFGMGVGSLCVRRSRFFCRRIDAKNAQTVWQQLSASWKSYSGGRCGVSVNSERGWLRHCWQPFPWSNGNYLSTYANAALIRSASVHRAGLIAGVDASFDCRLPGGFRQEIGPACG